MMDLKADLTRCVREVLSRSEILNFVSRDYSIYALSIRTLDRRLREYQIFYNKRTLLWMKFFLQTRPKRPPKIKKSKTGYTFSTKIREPLEGEGILGAPPRQLLNNPPPGSCRAQIVVHPFLRISASDFFT